MKALMLLCSLVTSIPAANLKGKVVGVKNGNAIEILNNGKVMGVKLYGIDCPAKSYAAGKTARHFIADQAFMNDVQLEIMGTQPDGDLIGKIILADGRDLGVEMLKAGIVWWDKLNSPEEASLAKVEKQARDAYLGIWAGASVDDDENDWGKEVLAKREQADKGEGLASVVSNGAMLTAASGN
jgi:micrococcal nuclease